jgi:hypothetical protein
MPPDIEAGNERTPLLHDRRLSHLQREQDVESASTISSTLSKEEQQLADSTVGERLPYNDYTTIDWLHDLVHIHKTLSKCLQLTRAGQRLLQVQTNQLPLWTALQAPLALRRFLGMDCGGHHWCVDSCGRLLGGCRRCYRGRLEDRALQYQPVEEPRELLPRARRERVTFEAAPLRRARKRRADLQ